jgi:phage shock protein PspC (stress-responsive transcriptional regulator)
MNATQEYAATNSTATGPSATGPSATGPGAGQSAAQPLRRPASGRMLAGVAAGVGRSLGIDPVVVRVAFLVLTLAGGAGVPLYVAGWLLIPDEESGESLAADLIRSFSAGR